MAVDHLSELGELLNRRKRAWDESDGPDLLHAWRAFQEAQRVCAAILVALNEWTDRRKN